MKLPDLFLYALITVMVYLLGLLCVILTEAAFAENVPKYKIAVLDTGYDPARAQHPAKLCSTGHYDFSTHTANVNYVHTHGTEVIDLIAEKLKDIDYCIIVFQVFDSGKRDTTGNFQFYATSVEQSLNDAIGLKVAAVNASYGGLKSLEPEKNGFRNLATAKIPAFVAAGNEQMNFDKACNYFPACYLFKNIIVVGAQDYENPKRHYSESNYGKRVDIWAPGYYKGTDGIMSRGTSYAAPRALAEYILFLSQRDAAKSK